MVARFVALSWAESWQQLYQTICMRHQGVEQAVTQSLPVGDGAGRRGARSHGRMALTSGRAPWKRIVDIVEPTFHRRGVECRIAHEMSDDIFDEPLIASALPVPRFAGQVGKILVEMPGGLP